MEKNTNTQVKESGVPQKHVSAFEPLTLILGIVLAALSAVICMQIIGKVGVTPNTSLIGAIFAMVLSRIPIGNAKKLRSLERQNLIQTIVSGAGFSAANCGFIAVAILFLMGEEKYIIPMAIGCMIGSGLSVLVVGRIFDSKIFPGSGAWPPGVATASALEAGDEGGEKGKRLIQGLVLGVIGSFFKIPVAGIGIVFIANIFSMIALGAGLILRGFSAQLFGGFDMGASSIPQGVMIGAGMIALAQSVVAIFGTKKATTNKPEEKVVPVSEVTVSDSQAKKTIVSSLFMHVGGAFITSIITGVITQMPPRQFILWLLWCAISSVVAMILVGMAAMQSGWFPAFAITTIFMTFGLLFQFPPLPLAIMTGYISSVGPCFADMGYDLKTGWLLRGKGVDRAYELDGRKQQVIVEFIGVILGIAVVMVFGVLFLKDSIIPPISNVFASAVSAGADIALLKSLALWAIPGAILQLVFGNKGVGVLFATGLLLNNPIYGIGVLAAVIIRMIFGTEFMEIRDAGLIAGDGLFGFFSSILKAFF